MTMRNYFLVLLILPWDKLEYEANVLDVKVSGPDSQYGFCPVYEDYKDALEHAGGDDDLVVMVKERGCHADSV